MSNELEKYREYIDRLGLTEDQGRDLIGALQCVAESLLDKKYMLKAENEEEPTESQ